MPRIIGTDIPDHKRLVVSLTYIYGIGRKRAEDICKALSLDSEAKARELSQEKIAEINRHLQSEYVVEGDLRRQTQGNIQRLQSIGSYRGRRHRLGLPVRGQRTITNARTRKGKKKNVIGKKK